MKHKKRVLVTAAVLVIILAALGAYQIYRYPAMFRSLPDRALGESEIETMRNEIFAHGEVNILVAYFSYSGTTETIAHSIHKRKNGSGSI